MTSSKTTMRRRVAEAGGYYSRQSGRWVSPSKTTMRRRVAEAGGYYSRQSGKWVIPGRASNLAGSAEWETSWHATLEEAYDASRGLSDARERADRWDAAEGAYLRSMR